MEPDSCQLFRTVGANGIDAIFLFNLQHVSILLEWRVIETILQVPQLSFKREEA